MSLQLLKFIVIILISIYTAACSLIGSPQAEDVQIVQVTGKTCPEPRPQMCTRDYRPVCATRDTGVRCVTNPCPSTEEKTYGNACSACADHNVISYRNGACEKQKNNVPKMDVK